MKCDCDDPVNALCRCTLSMHSYLSPLSPLSRVLLQLFVGEDWTGDGTLNRDEFEHALSKAGLFLTSPEVSTIMRAWDSLGDGRIHYDGWISSLRFAPITLSLSAAPML